MIAARALASNVLVRVFEDRAFAAAALDAEIERHPQIDPRDTALATELVYGVLRTYGFLEAKLREKSTRDLPHSHAIRAALLMGAYTLFFLDRVPAFAAVNEAVEAVRAEESAAAPYANAVLRAIGRELDPRPKLSDALVEGAPGWLRGALRRSLGRGGATQFLAAIGDVPPLDVAVRAAAERDAIAEELRARGIEVTQGAHSPRALHLRGSVHPRDLPGVGDSLLVQEEGAQLVALALGASPGERVLDACAGRGNKSWFLAHEVGAEGRVVATDLHPRKLDVLARVAAHVETRAVDWTIGGGGLAADFDAALVDAPCSGTGTLRRRPEIQWLREASSVAELATIQRTIAARVASHVRDGGRLVFAVCSVLREECEDVVAALPDLVKPVVLEPRPVPLAVAGGATTQRLLPHVHGTDGYFIASFTVRR